MFNNCISEKKKESIFHYFSIIDLQDLPMTILRPSYRTWDSILLGSMIQSVQFIVGGFSILAHVMVLCPLCVCVYVCVIFLFQMISPLWQHGQLCWNQIDSILSFSKFLQIFRIQTEPVNFMSWCFVHCVCVVYSLSFCFK